MTAKNNPPNRRQVNFRFKPETIDILNHLAATYGQTKTTLVENAIIYAYARLAAGRREEAPDEAD